MSLLRVQEHPKALMAHKSALLPCGQVPGVLSPSSPPQAQKGRETWLSPPATSILSTPGLEHDMLTLDQINQMSDLIRTTYKTGTEFASLVTSTGLGKVYGGTETEVFIPLQAGKSYFHTHSETNAHASTTDILQMIRHGLSKIYVGSISFWTRKPTIIEVPYPVDYSHILKSLIQRIRYTGLLPYTKQMSDYLKSTNTTIPLRLVVYSKKGRSPVAEHQIINWGIGWDAHPKHGL